MKMHRPPVWIDTLLKRYCDQDLWESIEGDLHELYQVDIDHGSINQAKRKYFFNAINFLRYRRLRNKKNSKTQNNMDLFNNYLKVSFRDLKGHKVFTAINLSGLIVGFTASLFILQYVLFENSFDLFNTDYEQIYRVYNDRFQNGELVQHGTITYPTIGPTLIKDYPEVQAYSRLTPAGRSYITFENELFLMEDFIIADEHFLKMFTYPTIEGDINTALKEVGNIALTKTYAARLLKSNEAYSTLIGKQLKLNSLDFPFIITAILEDPPANSHLQFKVLISYASYISMAGEGADNSWEWSDFFHYIKLKKGTSPELFQAKLQDFGKKYFKNGEVSGAVEEFYIQPLNEAHLYSDFEYEIGETNNGKSIWLLLGVSLLIIVIAWINFINLTTSRALQRAKEVGIRKVLGAHKKQLFNQFLVETYLINSIALVLSVLLMILLQPIFNSVTESNLDLSVLLKGTVSNIPFPILFAGIFLISLFIIGSYPSFILSRFRTQDVLKGRSKITDIAYIRKGLVIFQFVTAIILISGSIAIYKQIAFMQSQELGMDIDNTIVLYGPQLTDWDSTYIPKLASFKQELLSNPGITSVTTSSRIFGNRLGRFFNLQSPAAPEYSDITTNFMNVDYDFMSHYNINLISGRDFTFTDHKYNGREVNKVMMNKAAIEQFKFNNESDAIGQKLTIQGREWEIIGVVDNFYQNTMKQNIEPIIFMPYYSHNDYYSIKLTGSDKNLVIEAINEVYDTFYPGNYFDYFFMEDYYSEQYVEDERISQLSRYFTFLALIVAVLGLYGLVMITLSKRSKEIGVRKVLGANFSELIYMLGREFTILIGISILLGIPVSIYLVDNLLNNYANTFDANWTLYAISGLILFMVSIVTILLQMNRVSAINPIDSLRNE